MNLKCLPRSRKDFLSKIEFIRENIKQFFVSITKFLVFTSMFIALNGMLVTVFSSFLYEVAIKKGILLASFLITFSIYNLNKVTDKAEDSINRPDIHSWNKMYFLGPSIISLIFSLIIGASIGPNFILIILVPIILGLFYNCKISESIPRLKEVVGAKSFFVAFCWAFNGSLFPAFSQQVELDKIVLVFVYIFIQIMVNTVIFDTVDIKGDINAKIKTLPALLGRNKTLIFLAAINSLTIPLVIVCISSGLFLNNICALIFGIAYGYIIIWIFRCKSNRTLKTELVVDGEWIPLIVFMKIPLLIL